MAKKTKLIKALNDGERKSLAKKLKAISCLERAKKIYACKFGLNDGIYKSNVEVGVRFKITREAVRQTILKVSKLLK